MVYNLFLTIFKYMMAHLQSLRKQNILPLAKLAKKQTQIMALRSMVLKLLRMMGPPTLYILRDKEVHLSRQEVHYMPT